MNAGIGGDRLGLLVAEGLAAFPATEASELLHSLVELDRPQVSAGIATAARLVAAAAESAGLADVAVRWVRSGSRPWTFVVPRPWTPIRAELSVAGAGGGLRIPVYPGTPCALGTNSAATDPEGATGHLVSYDPSLGDVPATARGQWVLVRRPAQLPRSVIRRCVDVGALGIVTDVAERDGACGRIELPEGSPLVVWSLTSWAVDRLVQAAGARAVTGVVELGPTQEDMPIVTADSPAGDPALPPIVVTAHLCHRGPAANDNGSGVVAALAVMRLLASLPGLRSLCWHRRVRAVWAPEFVGTAAWLNHETETLGRAAPLALVNLDMVGEEPALAGGPLVLEGTPSHVGSFLEALMAAALDRVPAPRSWSGAPVVPARPWAEAPFAGGSDHALLADRSIGRPAVQLGHWPDRRHHTSADTLDAVDLGELRRVTAVTAAVAGLLATATEDDAADVLRLVAVRGARRVAEEAAAALPSAGAGTGTPVSPAPGGPLWRTLRVHAAAAADLRAVTHVLPPDTRGARLPVTPWLRWLAAQCSVHEHALGWGHRSPAADDQPATAVDPDLPTVLRPCWPGPFNLQGLIEASRDPWRTWLDDEVRSDRSHYAQCVAIALALDGASTVAEVIAEATLSGGQAPDTSLAIRFLECLVASGWVERVTE